MSPTFAFGAYVAEVEVNQGTGMVRVHKLTAAQDCGIGINPMAMEGQLEGAVQMGMGIVLSEELFLKKGFTLNGSFLNYKMPLMLDMPEIKTILVDIVDPHGPFGAKGGPEGTVIPVPSAIANAIYDAVGVRLKELPITPEKILKALEKKK